MSLCRDNTPRDNIGDIKKVIKLYITNLRNILVRFSKKDPEFSSILFGFAFILSLLLSLVLASTLAFAPYGLRSAAAQLGFGQDNSDQFGGGGSTDQFGGGGSTDQFGGGGSTDQFGGGGSTDQFGGGGSTDQFGGGGSTDQFGGGGSTDQFGGGGSVQPYTNYDYGIAMKYPPGWTLHYEESIASDSGAAGVEYLTSFDTGSGAVLRLLYLPLSENIPDDQYNSMYYDAVKNLPGTEIVSSLPVSVGYDLPGGAMAYTTTPDDDPGSKIAVYEAWGKILNKPYGYLHFKFVANDLNLWETYLTEAAEIMDTVDVIQ
jgi:hypothetical protein